MSLITALFISTSMQLGLPPGLLESLCYVESTHNINAIHHNDGDSDSIGICQIKLKTAQWLGFKGTEQQLFDPKINIFYAGKYLKYQIKRYSNHSRAVVAYNKGNAKDLTNSKYQYKVFNIWQMKK